MDRDLWKASNKSHEQQEDHADGQPGAPGPRIEDHPDPAKAGLLQPNRLLLIAQRLSRISAHVPFADHGSLRAMNQSVVSHDNARLIRWHCSRAGHARSPGSSDSHPWPAQALGRRPRGRKGKGAWHRVGRSPARRPRVRRTRPWPWAELGVSRRSLHSRHAPIFVSRPERWVRLNAYALSVAAASRRSGTKKAGACAGSMTMRRLDDDRVAWRLRAAEATPTGRVRVPGSGGDSGQSRLPDGRDAECGKRSARCSRRLRGSARDTLGAAIRRATASGTSHHHEPPQIPPMASHWGDHEICRSASGKASHVSAAANSSMPAKRSAADLARALAMAAVEGGRDTWNRDYRRTKDPGDRLGERPSDEWRAPRSASRTRCIPGCRRPSAGRGPDLPGVAPGSCSSGPDDDAGLGELLVVRRPEARASPKSATSARPPAKRMFSGLTSRCSTPRPWA